jgi:NTE family protein
MPSYVIKFILIFICLICQTVVFAQNKGVGLVLSGGGASGFAHVGVIKALEENNIPIDYISGTSTGALVGALYAVGYTPKEIEDYILSPEFQLMTQGAVKSSQEFLLRESDPTASTVSFSVSLDSMFQKSLPTNVIRPELLDFEMLHLFGIPGASAKNNFDSLMVPFRCVASDIVAKQSTVFNQGYLNQAVRASMTFPFFVNPIRINGVLYFDGGLYNNFPGDVMCANFNPQFVIGSNVSYNASPPREDDLISQITNMLVTPSNFTIPCENSILIQPKTNISTFEFDEVEQAINQGYASTILMMDSIKKLVSCRTTPEELAAKRAKFLSKLPPFKISEVQTSNSRRLDESYVRKSILKNNKQQVLTYQQMERRYFRTYATPQIDYLFPTIDLKDDSTYKLHVDVTSTKNLRVDFGGIVSSRAINTGFVQLNYFHLARTASMIEVNSYFGKFYGSGKISGEIHLPSYYPVSFKGYFCLNRYDYFKSFATFFEDVQPSFLVQYETYAGGQVKIPLFNNSKSVFDYKHFELVDNYYQTTEFTNKDTTDLTRFYGDAVSFLLEQNSLNRKQFASAGTLLSFNAKLVQGIEHSVSGSTSPTNYDYRNHHQWITLNAEFHTFPLHKKHISIGVHGIASVSSQSLFKNYTATLLNLNSFQALPDLKTFFLPEYRSPQFISGGLNLIVSPAKHIDIRVDGYMFQPFKQLTQNDDGTFGYSPLFKGESIVAAASAIYHSPIGPLRVTANYFPLQAQPIYLQFSYGFILFNDKAIR